MDGVSSPFLYYMYANGMRFIQIACDIRNHGYGHVVDAAPFTFCRFFGIREQGRCNT